MCFIQLNNKKKSAQLKLGKTFVQTHKKAEIWMTNKHIKGTHTSLVIREIQISSTMLNDWPTRMAKIKNVLAIPLQGKYPREILTYEHKIFS